MSEKVKQFFLEEAEASSGESSGVEDSDMDCLSSSLSMDTDTAESPSFYRKFDVAEQRDIDARLRDSDIEDMDIGSEEPDSEERGKQQNHEGENKHHSPGAVEEEEGGEDQGEPDQNTNQGESDQDSNRGESDQDSNRGESDQDSNRGEPDQDSNRGEPDQDSNRGEPDQDSNQGEPDQDSNQGEPDQDSNQGEPDQDQNSNQGEPDQDSNQGEPDQDSNQGEPDRDSNQGEPDQDQNSNQGEPDQDQNSNQGDMEGEDDPGEDSTSDTEEDRDVSTTIDLNRFSATQVGIISLKNFYFRMLKDNTALEEFLIHPNLLSKQSSAKSKKATCCFVLVVCPMSISVPENTLTFNTDFVQDINKLHQLHGYAVQRCSDFVYRLFVETVSSPRLSSFTNSMQKIFGKLCIVRTVLPSKTLTARQAVEIPHFDQCCWSKFGTDMCQQVMRKCGFNSATSAHNGTYESDMDKLTELDVEFNYRAAESFVSKLVEHVQSEDEVELILSRIASVSMVEFIAEKRLPSNMVDEGFWFAAKPVAVAFSHHEYKQNVIQRICHNPFLVRDELYRKKSISSILSDSFVSAVPELQEVSPLFDVTKSASQNLHDWSSNFELRTKRELYLLQEFVARCGMVKYDGLGHSVEPISHEDLVHILLIALTQRTRRQQCIIFSGGYSCGKSTFMNSIRGLFSKRATKVISLNETNQSFLLEGTESARLVVYDDMTTPGAVALDTLYRHVTDGNELVTVHRKGKTARDVAFPPMIITTNVKPEDIPEGLRTRVRVISVQKMIRPVTTIDNKSFVSYSLKSFMTWLFSAVPITFMGTELSIPHVVDSALNYQQNLLDRLTNHIISSDDIEVNDEDFVEIAARIIFNPRELACIPSFQSVQNRCASLTVQMNIRKRILELHTSIPERYALLSASECVKQTLLDKFKESDISSNRLYRDVLEMLTTLSMISESSLIIPNAIKIAAAECNNTRDCTCSVCFQVHYKTKRIHLRSTSDACPVCTLVKRFGEKCEAVLY